MIFNTDMTFTGLCALSALSWALMYSSRDKGALPKIFWLFPPVLECLTGVILLLAVIWAAFPAPVFSLGILITFVVSLWLISSGISDFFETRKKWLAFESIRSCFLARKLFNKTLRVRKRNSKRKKKETEEPSLQELQNSRD